MHSTTGYASRLHDDQRARLNLMSTTIRRIGIARFAHFHFHSWMIVGERWVKLAVQNPAHELLDTRPPGYVPLLQCK